MAKFISTQTEFVYIESCEAYLFFQSTNVNITLK